MPALWIARRTKAAAPLAGALAAVAVLGSVSLAMPASLQAATSSKAEVIPPAAPSSPGAIERQPVPGPPATADNGVRSLEMPCHSGLLKGLYRAPLRSARGRAVLLIGANGRPVASLDPLASALRDKDYAVLAVQNPAMIRTQRSPQHTYVIDPTGGRTDSFDKSLRDLHSVIRFLGSEPSCDASSLAVIGEGLGANLAALFASTEPRVACLAYIEPGQNCDPLLTRRSLSHTARLPSLLISGDLSQAFGQVFQQTGSPNFSVVAAKSLEAESPKSAASADETPRRLEAVVSWLESHYPPVHP